MKTYTKGFCPVNRKGGLRRVVFRYVGGMGAVDGWMVGQWMAQMRFYSILASL